MQFQKVMPVLFFCFFLLSIMSACGGAGETVSSDPEINTAADAVPVGRYVEEITDLPAAGLLSEGCAQAGRLFRLDDGRLLLTDPDTSFFVSGDGGASWEPEEQAWQTRMLQNGDRILDMAVTGDYTCAVIYEAAADGVQNWENQRLLIVRPDGFQMPVTSVDTGSQYFLRKVFLEKSRIFVSVFCDDRFRIYEVTKDGHVSVILTLDDREPEQICFAGGLMILYGNEYDIPVIYDMEEECYVEDEALAVFFDETYEKETPFLFTGEDGALYLAGKGGLYRHVAGGSAIEQVIDGTLSVLASPAYLLKDMMTMCDGQFLAVFRNGRLARFRYDPEIPSRPAETLSVYSLEENDTVRQAVTSFMLSYPDVYVRYDTGLTGEDALTADDARKKLNARIMAGKGPDLIIMDDIPLEPYAEKGVLRDLTPILTSLEGTKSVFPNLTEAMRMEEAVYAFPCEIQLPVIFAPPQKIACIEELGDIADLAEALRLQNPGMDLLGIDSEREILQLFAGPVQPGWKTDDGSLDKIAVTDFLKQCGRIYAAQMDSLPEKRPELYVIRTGRYQQDTFASLKVLEYMGGYLRIGAGVICDAYSYAQLLSAPECGWKLLSAGEGRVFCASTLMGITATAQNPECAENFLRFCLGEDVQKQLFYGLPVTRRALEKSLETGSGTGAAQTDPEARDGTYGSEYMADSDGRLLTLDILCPDTEDVAELERIIQAADTPYLADHVLEEAVFEQGAAYLQGSITLEEALSGIEKKLSIYLAE